MKFDITRANFRKHGVGPPVEEANAVRVGDKIRWVIELETLEELMAIVSREGELIVYPPNPDIPAIQIYDDYIE